LFEIFKFYIPQTLVFPVKHPTVLLLAITRSELFPEKPFDSENFELSACVYEPI